MRGHALLATTRAPRGSGGPPQAGPALRSKRPAPPEASTSHAATSSRQDAGTSQPQWSTRQLTVNDAIALSDTSQAPDIKTASPVMSTSTSCVYAGTSQPQWSAAPAPLPAFV